MAYTCSKDPSHQSSDSDYCSICGAKIVGGVSALDPSAASNTPSAAPAAQGEVCPDCGIPRRPGARFCEVCRYNYETRTSGGVATIIPQAPAVQSPAPIDSLHSDAVPLTDTAPATSRPAVATPTAAGWEAVIRVDASLYTDPDPSVPCPANDPERVFPLDLTENLIGRRSEKQDIHPEIPVSDPGVSHRHAKIYKEDDGSLSILDVGSTNSTYVNGAEAAAGVRVPLTEASEITIGCWTRITLRKSGS